MRECRWVMGGLSSGPRSRREDHASIRKEPAAEGGDGGGALTSSPPPFPKPPFLPRHAHTSYIHFWSISANLHHICICSRIKRNVYKYPVSGKPNQFLQHAEELSTMSQDNRSPSPERRWVWLVAPTGDAEWEGGKHVRHAKSH